MRKPATPRSAPPVSPGRRRALQRGPSDENAQPLLKKSPSVSVPWFKIGNHAVVHGLTSRPELSEKTAVITSLPTADQPRYGIQLVDTGEQVLVLGDKLRPPSLS